MVATKSERRGYQPYARSAVQVNRHFKLVQFIESPWITVVAAAIIALLMLAFLWFNSTLKKSSNEVNLSLKRNTYAELVDWHTSGPLLFRCPVVWLRVRNYNSVPIKELVFHYTLFDQDDKPVDQGNHTITEEIAPGEVKNFFEEYLWFTDFNSNKLGINLTNVKAE
jgi:hypothetical protein